MEQPIVTVFDEGADEPSILRGLEALAADAYRNLAISPLPANNSPADVS
jgi:hypothetical protein